MIKRISIVAAVIAVASVLAGAINAHPVVILAIVGGGLVGFVSNLLPTESTRKEALRAVVVVVLVTTFLGGLTQATLAGLFTLWGIFLGLGIGLPIGFFFSRE